MIVIINGPLGIGKTETAWELLAMFEKAVMLDGDFLGAVQPFKIDDEARVAYLYRTLAHVIAFHRENGYEHFVINYVFEHPDSLRDLRQRLALMDSEIYAFRLICAADEHARRIRQRRSLAGDEQLAWELQRGPELAAIQERNALLGDLGFPLDTTLLSTRDAAKALWDNLHEQVTLQPYNLDWPQAFEDEREAIAAALGGRITGIHHIGSTAVPGLAAKPVIDILLTVRKLEEAEACIAPLAGLGYRFIDYPDNTERRFFRKGQPRTHHVHIVAEGGQEHREHIAFRDALRADPAAMAAYAALKADLASRFSAARASYSSSKSDFVRQMLSGTEPSA